LEGQWRLGILLFSSALAAVGCAKGTADEDGGRPDVSHLDGAALYASHCAACHGEVGEGGVGPTLIDWDRDEDTLIDIVEVRMPTTNPTACDEACATAVARYVIAAFTSEALACDEVQPGARQLRLLTRREYRNTIFDLFPSFSSDATGSADDCRTAHFRYDPRGRALSSVHVAGSFNEWSSSAWPMRLDPSTGAFTLERELGEGTHQYKFVLDGSEWIADPDNADGADDGFGSYNSVITIACDAAPDPSTGALADPTTSFPVETRPDGFPFDDHAASGRVTAVHADEQIRAAERIVSALGDDIEDLAPCDLAEGASCAEEFARTFGERAFRRPPTDAEIARYGALVLAGDSPIDGMRVAVRAFLVSPHFLYRSETGEPLEDGSFALTGWEIASALSYGLWGSMPDEALFAAARDGALSSDEDLEREARRLLDDSRARVTIRAFAVQWLGVEAISDQPKSAVLFPDADDALREAMLEETASFVAHVVFDGSGRYDELVSADYTFADARLAAHYGLDGVGEEGNQRVTTAEVRRAGVLGHAALLARYAHSDQSSPIQRGIFVRRRLLCQEFAAPPPDAGGVPDVDPSATTRERFAQHTEREACASCHRYIDDLGFGFESFDALGRYRTMDGDLPVDSRGNLNDVEGLGTNTDAPFSTLPELGRILAESDAAEACFVRQYVRFQRGAREGAAERCGIDALTKRFHDSGGDIRSLIVESYLSPAFRRRR